MKVPLSTPWGEEGLWFVEELSPTSQDGEKKYLLTYESGPVKIIYDPSKEKWHVGAIVTRYSVNATAGVLPLINAKDCIGLAKCVAPLEFSRDTYAELCELIEAESGTYPELSIPLPEHLPVTMDAESLKNAVEKYKTISF